MDTDDIYDSLDEYMTVSNNENKLKVLNSIKGASMMPCSFCNVAYL